MLQEEKEAEKMILEAYAALLLAFLSTERLVSLISFPIPTFPVFLINCFATLSLTVRAHEMRLPNACQITACRFWYLCWRDSWYVFI